MEAVIDPLAGFCGGVRRAIKLAENILSRGGDLVVKGELIHNNLEMRRLYALGLQAIDELDQAGDKPVLVRTHGEEGAFFRRAAEIGLRCVDATCPKVKRSQKVIQKAYKNNKQIVIVGRLHHPEVIALQGHCAGQAIVINEDRQPAYIDPHKPTLLIAQTTVSPQTFTQWQEKLGDWIENLEVFDSRCDFVTRRQQELAEFAAQHPAIVFVGGQHSSNTALLCDVCRRVNPNTFFVEDETEIDPRWFKGFKRVGISGSASTPMWLLERVARAVESMVEAEST